MRSPRHEPIGGYSVVMFTVTMAVIALGLGAPVLVGLSSMYGPRMTGTLYVCAIALIAVPLLRMSSYDVRIHADPVARELRVVRERWWGRREQVLPWEEIAQWRVVESMGSVVIEETSGARTRLMLHTQQSSPRRRPASVQRATAVLEEHLGDMRDRSGEQAASRRARRTLIASVLVAVVTVGPGLAFLLLAITD